MINTAQGFIHHTLDPRLAGGSPESGPEPVAELIGVFAKTRAHQVMVDITANVGLKNQQILFVVCKDTTERHR